ncbi:MAG: FMN-binding negative transcriptional regulator [Gemmatimonadetes bacterium]|nr:FMN-binding negative transcriptional regulator [Gemmatimonadota bacterium]
MWIPRTFRETDPSVLHGLIEANSFGTLFSRDDSDPWATHLPFMIDRERGEHGTLIAHMARANPHWKTWTGQTRVLAVFQGPHAYISPAWYEDQVTVPTWNYAVVHAYGTPRLIEEPQELRPIVERLTRLHEGDESPWDLERAEPVMETELKAIVGFEIPIDRLEGKFKFNQNRSREDQAGVVRALRDAEDPLERRVGEIMDDNLTREDR